MKNILIGFLTGVILLLTIGQASKKEGYECITKYSSDPSEYHSNWGDEVQLWTNSKRWSADNSGYIGETTLTKMYDEGWRVIAVQKTNASAVQKQFVWVFERKK